MSTLSQLEADLYRKLKYASSPATEVTTRLRAFLNETQDEVLSMPGMSALRTPSFTFDSVASQAQYAIPSGIARVLRVYETTNDTRLWPESADWYRTVLPDVSAQTGTPDRYVDLGYTSIATQPTTSTGITAFVDSTSASDTNTAYLEGYRLTGSFRSVSVTMTGATAVELTAAITDWKVLTKFYLSAAAVGTVTLVQEAEGGTELARIPIGHTMARHRALALVPTPASAITYTVDAEIDAPAMANATDEPVLPVRFHRVLGIGARMKEYEYHDDTRVTLAREEFERACSQLRFYLFSTAAGSPNLRGSGTAKPSQFGANYPAGS